MNLPCIYHFLCLAICSRKFMHILRHGSLHKNLNQYSSRGFEVLVNARVSKKILLMVNFFIGQVNSQPRPQRTPFEQGWWILILCWTFKRTKTPKVFSIMSYTLCTTFHINIHPFRSNHQRCSMKKDVLRNFTNFPVNFAKFLWQFSQKLHHRSLNASPVYEASDQHCRERAGNFL